MSCRILFAWEMGENFGHLTRDLGIATTLRNAGHEVVFVVRDPRVAEELLTPAGFKFLPIPILAHTVRLTQPPANYSEVLIGQGYGDEVTLSALVREWLHLFTLIQPGVIVIDHAPTALIAARIKTISTVQIGTGFEVPPNVSPLPTIRPWEALAPERLVNADQVALQTINAVLHMHTRPPLSRVADLFKDGPAVLTTFAELDHYGARTDREYIGPLQVEPSLVPIDWPTESGPKVLAYLRPSLPTLDTLLAALVELNACVICVIPNLPLAIKQRFENSQIKFVANAIPLRPLLPNTDIVINYGGAGTIATTLLAGVPMLLVPQMVEQYLGARRVAAISAGIVMPSQTTQPQFRTALNTLLNDRRYRDAARRFSHQHREFKTNLAIDKAANLIMATMTHSGIMT